MSYISITEDEIKIMLGEIGVDSIDDLFADIPKSIRPDKKPDLPSPLSEQELSFHIGNLAEKNRIHTSFIGAGSYNHYIPAAVDHLSSRSEFFTAYTPYQPEVSQGTLAVIFEFQTMICKLTGMDVANASMYDGATSVAESVLMSIRANKKNKVLISRTVHPHYRDVLKTYCWASGIGYLEADFSDGSSPSDDLKKKLDNDVSAVVVQNPNFFGVIEDIDEIASLTHGNNSNLIVTVNEPVSLGLLKNPGNSGADIVCGDAQAFGNPMGFGGPILGFISAKKEFLRMMPGRLTGKTTDLDGKTCYVLTLQTREQHIRRERATSNICSNQALCALRSVIYLSIVGPRLRELADLNHRMASYLKARLSEKGFTPVFERPFFNEIVMRHKTADKLDHWLKDLGYIPGLYLGGHYKELKDCVLFCATEMTSKSDIDNFIKHI
ncbi:MAG: aminomethyl-transferring glycine dehydrogenase subunit GcvPA [Spirochaetes bacterium]|jgi:glycine dehydrogenase subunit 1|nr:aminomethyl-transferring glycine dehydrogenase subunit GcvPA [Spirochaetota bacterium]